MPATKFETFQGKAHWNSLTNIDKYGKWSIKLYLDPPSKEKFQELVAEHGILTRLSKDDDGYYANFGRHQKKTYGPKEIIFNPPVIVEADGKTPFLGKVGHGSDVTVTAELYPYTVPASGGKKGKALRLASVRIDTLVPFDVEEHGNEREVKQISALKGTPAQAGY